MRSFPAFPRYISRDTSCRTAEPSFFVLFRLLVPGHELCLSINAPQNKGTFEEMLYRSALKAASLSGMSVGTARFSSEREWFGVSPFCRKEEKDLFVSIFRFDVLKSIDLAKGEKVQGRFPKMFPDSDVFERSPHGTVICKDGSRYLFRESTEDLLAEGFAACIEILKDRFSPSDRYLSSIR